MATVQANQTTMGREIGEIKKDVKEIGANVTSIVAQAPQFVTKTDCMAGQQDLKDRMDGRREVTGQHDVREHIARWNGDKRRNLGSTIKLIAAIASLVVLFSSMIAFGVHTLNRQARTEQLIEQLVEQKSPPAAR
jgi:hypothetical protein